MSCEAVFCPSDCTELEPWRRGFSTEYCRKYQKHITFSHVAGGLIRPPKCIVDEASNQVTEREGAENV